MMKQCPIILIIDMGGYSYNIYSTGKITKAKQIL